MKNKNMSSLVQYRYLNIKIHTLAYDKRNLEVKILWASLLCIFSLKWRLLEEDLLGFYSQKTSSTVVTNVPRTGDSI